jgi:hypothetical protein
MPTAAEVHQPEDAVSPDGEPASLNRGDRPRSTTSRRTGSGVSVVDRQSGGVRRRRPTEPTTSIAQAEESTTDPDDRAMATAEPASAEPATAEPATGRRLGLRWGRVVPWTLAGLGLVGTLAFGHAWASQRAALGQQAQVQTVSRDFLLALTNFDAKNVDADFSRIQGYATGTFASQSNQFFGSTIRTQLEAALASSRGQIRSQYVQSLSGDQASVYSVVDQTYVNNKMQSPAADELRIDTNLTKVGGTWKVAAVTVLNNASGNSSATGSATGSGSTPNSTAGSSGG